MMTVKKWKGVSALKVAEYFTDLEEQRELGDYHANEKGEAVECPGGWEGSLAASLGLSGDVTMEQLLHILDGRHPITGERLVAFRKDRIATHDLTFSPDKSVSAVRALGSEEVRTGIDKAQAAAVAEAIAWMERNVQLVRRNDGKTRIAETAAEVLAVSFAHHTSRQTGTAATRNLPPDPQVHTHVLVPMCRRHDGRIVAVTSQALFEMRQEMDAVYQAALAMELTKLGFEIDRRTGRGRKYCAIKGVSKDLCAAWSSRSREIGDKQTELIAEFREKYGRAPTIVELRDQSIRHRVAKGHGHSNPGEFWREVGKNFGVTAETIEGLRTGGPPSREMGRAQIVSELLGTNGLTEEHATFDMPTLQRRIFQHAAGVLTVRETERLLAELIDSGELVKLGKDQWTTREMHGIEAQVIAWRERRRDLPVSLPADSQIWKAIRTMQTERGITLSGEQLDAFSAMLRNGFTAVTGEAGVGKGVVLGAAAEVWRAQGRRVFACAVAGATAQRLADELGPEVRAMTIAGLLTEVRHGRLQLRPDDVVAIDEAGMIGTRQWSEIAAATGDAPTVVALGDEAQLSPLSAGGLWPILAAGGPKLTEIRRTKLAWERDAWRALRAGDAAGALAGYAEHGRLAVADTRADALEAAVTAWDADGRRGLVITDASNAERYEANRQAQQRRVAAGELGEDAVTITTGYGKVALRGADRVIFHKQWRMGRGVQRVENGTTAEVVAVNSERGTLTVRTNESRARELEMTVADATAMLDLGYCAHVFKAQGATVDRAYVVVGGWQTRRQKLYVACSRARDGTWVFTDRRSLDIGIDADGLAVLAARGAQSQPRSSRVPVAIAVRAKLAALGEKSEAKLAAHQFGDAAVSAPVHEHGLSAASVHEHRPPSRPRRRSRVLTTREPLEARWCRKVKNIDARKRARSAREHAQAQVSRKQRNARIQRGMNLPATQDPHPGWVRALARLRQL